ncbi:MAG: elongation factor P maturation arginine rhamnosyltransferase EarP [Betaproteobacteria bacterium]
MQYLPPSPLSCDIFCRVVDNYGDIGVAWRLARQLAAEYAATIRLAVDDLASFQRLVPSIRTGIPMQRVGEVTIVEWRDGSDATRIAPAADLVIEAFGCGLPADYLNLMALRAPPPFWVNLEYLSAEPWVREHHLLPSPHVTLPLTSYFFFPGFTTRTGGLIRERDLITRRDTAARAAAKPTDQTGLHILVFGYDHAPVETLFTAISESKETVLCRVSEGALAERLERWRGSQAEIAPEGAPMHEFEVTPFVPLADFDDLLWRNDILFVRGEDSFVRAQWAAKPLVWHIYPQADDAHLKKLNAFLDLYCCGLSARAEAAMRRLWLAWNRPIREEIGPAWNDFLAHLPALNTHALDWSKRLADMPDLAANLLSFYRKNAKI